MTETHDTDGTDDAESKVRDLLRTGQAPFDPAARDRAVAAALASVDVVDAPRPITSAASRRRSRALPAMAVAAALLLVVALAGSGFWIRSADETAQTVSESDAASSDDGGFDAGADSDSPTDSSDSLEQAPAVPERQSSEESFDQSGAAGAAGLTLGDFATLDALFAALEDPNIPISPAAPEDPDGDGSGTASGGAVDGAPDVASRAAVTRCIEVLGGSASIDTTWQVDASVAGSAVLVVRRLSPTPGATLVVEVPTCTVLGQRPLPSN